MASRLESGSSKQEHGRVTHQGAGQRDALALAAGQLPRPAVEQMPDAEQLRRPRNLLLDLRLRRALRPQRKGDVVADGEVRIEAVALEHHGDAAGARRECR